LRIALASGLALRPQRGALLLIEMRLDGALGNRDIRPESAQVDEKPAAVAGPPAG
jgi:hypothetical protein